MASWQADLMKTTLDLPDELIHEVKLRAVIIFCRSPQQSFLRLASSLLLLSVFQALCNTGTQSGFAEQTSFQR
jgi:hypothetical protein